jgi:opacity protein-like surface antigen
MAAAGLETKNTEAWELIAEYQYSPTLKKVRYRLPDGTKRFVWKHKKG